MCWSPTSVSYTHLDVYKRQVLSLLGNLWPIALIAAGLYVLYQARRGEKQPADDTPQTADGKL